MYPKPLRRRTLIPENTVGEIHSDTLPSPLRGKDGDVMSGFCEKEG
jgi:hypothetical protein